MEDTTIEALKALADDIAAGNRPPMRQAIPVRHVENVNLASITPEAIRRRLQGHPMQAGPATGIEWYLIDHDACTAIYEAACPYCDGKGTIMAATTVDRHGVAVLPFTDPGSLCCPVCDSEIEARYEAEAHRLANPRRAPAKPVACREASWPCRACADCGEALPDDAPAQTKRCQPCAIINERERKREYMAAKREADRAESEI